MIVLMLEKVPAGLRGELSRWMIEPRQGVFIGKLSAMVREKLWEKSAKEAKGGSGMLVYPAPTEQGFTVRTFGETSRHIVDWEGLQLVRIPNRVSRKSLIEEPAVLPVSSQHETANQREKEDIFADE